MTNLTNLTNLNITLNKMSANKRLVDTTRATVVNEIIALIISEAKEHSFKNKRVAQKWIIVELLSDDNKNLDNYTKRALKVAKALLVDGYKIKKEALTTAQAENLIKSSKAIVNNLMKLDSEIIDDKGETEYSLAVNSELKVQVKTSEEHKARHLIEYINKKTNFDYYVFVIVNLKEKTGYIHSWISVKDFIKKREYMDFGYGNRWGLELIK